VSYKPLLWSLYGVADRARVGFGVAVFSNDADTEVVAALAGKTRSG
jgi:hypothetical protein